MVHLENVGKVYHTPRSPVRAIDGITLDIPPGQFVSIRGPSGCGKTTLLTVIGGLATATSGRVTVAGEELGAMSPAARAKFRGERIGFVFQTFHLLPYLTVSDNVALAANGVSQAATRDRVRELLGRFHLEHRLHHRPGELSTGECQRVAIARALLNRPSLLLADEPTGNLDAKHAGGVLDMLAAYHRDGGTVVLVTHQDWVSERAQRVVALRDGRIVAGDEGRENPEEAIRGISIDLNLPVPTSEVSRRSHGFFFRETLQLRAISGNHKRLYCCARKEVG